MKWICGSESKEADLYPILDQIRTAEVFVHVCVNMVTPNLN